MMIWLFATALALSLVTVLGQIRFERKAKKTGIHAEWKSYRRYATICKHFATLSALATGWTLSQLFIN